MDMFQAPTLLEEPFNGTTAFLTAEKERDGEFWSNPDYSP